MSDEAEPEAHDAEPEPRTAASGDAAILERAPRCLLAARGQQGLIVSPVAHWFDGEALWMTTAADAAKVAALRRDPRCLVAVVPDERDDGVIGLGRARVLSPADPVRFALHAPAIGGALAALAARNVATVADYALHAPQVPARWAPHHRVVIRVALESLRRARPPSGATRVTPALPTALPADVRRRLGGKRVVTVLWDEPPLRAASATWGPGLTLGFADDLPAAARPSTGERVAVLVDVDEGRPTEVVGAVLHGVLADGDALQADRAVWWRGFDVGRSDVTTVERGVHIPG